jgi:hypothetical protein
LFQQWVALLQFPAYEKDMSRFLPSFLLCAAMMTGCARQRALQMTMRPEPRETAPISTLHLAPNERDLYYAVRENKQDTMLIDFKSPCDPGNPYRATFVQINNPRGTADSLFVLYRGQADLFVVPDCGIDRLLPQTKVTMRFGIYHKKQNELPLGRRVHGFPLN